MNILEITEDKIFETLGKGKDPKYKPIDKTKLIKTVEPFDYTCLIKWLWDKIPLFPPFKK
jgi:hypothetical protein